MRNTVYQHWKSVYEKNVVVNKQRAKDKLEELEAKPLLCTVCGQTVNDINVEDHLLKHSGEVEKGCEYSLDLTWKEANREILIGTKYLRLYWNIRGHYIPTLLNALSLPNWYRVVDSNDTTVRWYGIKNKFIRTIWAVALFYLFT